ncbi:FeoB-associated Cys-rich membrane protein [Desulfobulbus elongatus]|uniref:FeoB-associated Cys-rich membrane protein n=1 Tax=Desulfobulbus elongatus TaxID=53332 RepID=UPI000A03DC98|nr:FeoB-associated Cys-rich membrane protein [Desulfobulbus elongatus]
MQHFLVVLAVAIAALFIGRRLWRFWRNAGTSCGCGCSGCDGAARPPAAKKSLPMHKP